MEATPTEDFCPASRDRTSLRFVVEEAVFVVFAACWLFIAVVEFPLLPIADSDLGTNSYSTRALMLSGLLLTQATLRFVLVRQPWLLVASSFAALVAPFICDLSGGFDHGRTITAAVLITLAASDLLFHEMHWKAIVQDLCALFLMGCAYVTLYSVTCCDPAPTFAPAAWLVVTSVVVMSIVAPWIVFRDARRCARNRFRNRDTIRHTRTSVSD